MTTTATESSAYIIDKVSETLKNGDEALVEKIVRLIIDAGKIFVYGVGRSGLVGKAFAMRMVQLGLNVFFIGETITPIVSPGDLVFVISNTGETMSAIQTANIARRVGADVVVITSRETSKLSHAGSLVVTLQVRRDERTKKLAPLGTLFETATLVFLDGLIAELMKEIGQDETDMRARHAIMV